MKTIVRHTSHHYIAWSFLGTYFVRTQYARDFRQLEILGTLVFLYY